MVNADSQKVQRRTALKTIAGGSASLAGYGTAVRVVNARGTTKKITTLAKGDKSAKSVEVSKRWYNHTQNARSARKQVQSSYRSHADVVSVGIGNGDRSIGGLLSHEIVVGVSSNDRAQSADLPDAVNGVPVRIRETEGTTKTCGDAQNDCYMDGQGAAHGGLACKCENQKDSTAYGTTCCRVYLDGSKYLMTARHLFLSSLENCESDTLEDFTQNMYLDGDSIDPVVGEPKYHYKDSDAALVGNDKSGISITNEVANEPDKGIVGRVTGDGLSYLKSSQDIIEKRGRCSCETYGRVNEIGIDEFCTYDTDQIKGMVRSSLTQKKRDSGGIVYYEPSTSTDELYMVNIAMGHPTDDTSQTKGTSGQHMYNAHGIWFGGTPFDG